MKFLSTVWYSILVYEVFVHFLVGDYKTLVVSKQVLCQGHILVFKNAQALRLNECHLV